MGAAYAAGIYPGVLTEEANYLSLLSTKGLSIVQGTFIMPLYC